LEMLSSYREQYSQYWLILMRNKLGLVVEQEGDEPAHLLRHFRGGCRQQPGCPQPSAPAATVVRQTLTAK
uniref:hypothetical protein n=1 Tax=Aquitalea magnusonii TaxID=332411 RepID=UPI0019563E94